MIKVPKYITFQPKIKKKAEKKQTKKREVRTSVQCQR